MQLARIMVDTLLRDLRYALRTLRKTPGFAAAVVGTLALGIGATTAMFSVVDGVLLRPPPYPAPERLAFIWSRFEPESGLDFPQFPVSIPEYLDFRRETRAFSGVAAISAPTSVVVSGEAGQPGEPRRLSAVAVTPDLFTVLGVDLHLGRSFNRVETSPSGPAAAVLGHALWRGRFGADSTIVGETVTLDGEPVTIVGVAPPELDMPAPVPDILLPVRWDRAGGDPRGSHGLVMVGRLAPDVSLDEARADMRGLMNAWAERYPDHHRGHEIFLRPLQEQRMGGVRDALLVLLGAVAFVLLIACANVTSLFQARGAARRSEYAVRVALGAGRGELARQVLAEALVLALAGGILGTLLAALGVPALLSLYPGALPAVAEVRVDVRVLGFALLVSTTSALVVGLLPAWRATGAAPAEALGEGDRGRTAGVRGRRLGRTLVVGQVALALLLVACAGLLVRSYLALQRVDPGFETRDILTARALAAGDEWEQVSGMWTRLRERLEATPGVRAAGLGSALPLAGGYGSNGFNIEGRPPVEPGQSHGVGQVSAVSPGWFETLGINLLRGRTFRDTDDARAPPVVVVSERLARRYFPGQDVLGKRIRALGFRESPWLTIVGVVDDVRALTLEDLPRPMWYLPLQQVAASYPWQYVARDVAISLRAETDPAALAGALRAAVHEVDPRVPLSDVRTMETIAATATADRRFTVALIGTFAGLALGLGAVGIYSVLAFWVSGRRREIGIRMALGAGVRRVLWHVVRQGLAITLVGLTLGLALAVALTRLLSSLLFGVSPTDVVALVAGSVFLIAVALLASFLAARHAARVDPLVALRAE